MARLPTAGGDTGTWGDVLNTFLQVGHASDGTNIGGRVEANKSSNYTLVPADSGKRLVATSAIAITVPALSTLGNGFEVEIVNDAGGTVTVGGANLTTVSLDDGNVVSVLEVNSKQRVVWMPALTDAKISALTATTPAANDSLPILDVSDTALSSSGSTRRVTVAALAGVGAPPYSAAVTYTTSQVTAGSDGNLYRAVASTTNHDPTTDGGTYWQLFLVRSSVSLAIPSRFATFAAGWAFSKDAVILGSATVTHQFADGNYDLSGGAPYTLNHPFGGQIVIQGNASTPANVQLRFGATDGFLVTEGSRLNLKGLTFRGNYPNTAWVNPKVGVFIRFGAHVRLDNCAFDYFYYGVQAAESSSAHLETVTVNHAGDVGIFAFTGSHIFANACTATNCNDSANGLGFGFRCEIGSSMWCVGCVANSNYMAGYSPNVGGSMRCTDSCTATSNGSFGWYALRSTIELNGVSAPSNSNGYCAVNIEGSQAFIASANCPGTVASGGGFQYYGWSHVKRGGGNTGGEGYDVTKNFVY